jgi:L-ascorbate metabolism protein UlaG (beta-lactamase superfamily)
MNIIWLGHGSFRIEIGDQVLLIDPWLNDNPMMQDQDAEAALAGTTHILVTHGHFDHTADIVEVSGKTGAPVSGIVELAQHLHGLGAHEGHAFNKGGTITLGNAAVTMVPASHSSSMQVGDESRYMGMETGFILRGDSKTLYFSGDTSIMADMDWIGDCYKPEIGIMSAGGYYTMDMAGVAYAAKRYFDFTTLIPCHYRTFPALEQSAEGLIRALPEVNVVEPQVMTPITV